MPQRAPPKRGEDQSHGFLVPRCGIGYAHGMCGIAGIYHYATDAPVSEDILRAMTAALAHRGPDDDGYAAAPGVALGHRRLAIVDVAGGGQPMGNSERTLWVVYNGEIYNHPSLQPELQRLGLAYRTQCDTETLLHGYAAWGDDVVTHLRGMFAFALWDEPRGRLLLARDPLGIKPLLYYDDGHKLVFASETRALLAHPDVPRRADPAALNFLLTFSYIPAPLTFLRGVRKLMPGERMIVDRDGARCERYWHPPVEVHDCPPVEAARVTRRLLRESVERHLMSDVPLGAFLSGGIDSSAIVGLLSEILPGKVRTFSIGFAEYPAFDERPHARRVADHFKTQHRELLLDRLDLRQTLPRVIRHFHEPFGDSSALPAYCVAQLAREEVKVILSGDGADELCAGYNKYTGYQWQARWQRLPGWLRRGLLEPMLLALPASRSAGGNLARKMHKVIRNARRPPGDLHYGYMEVLSLEQRAALLGDDTAHGLDLDAPRGYVEGLLDIAPNRSPLDRSLYADVANVLPNDMLTKVDTMSMAHGLEVRVPFLDLAFVEWMLRLEGAHKLRGGRTKAVLKDALADLLPGEILRRKKHGFEVPVGEWFRGPLRPVLEDFLSPANVERRGLFRPQAPQRLLREHLDGTQYHDWALWTLLVLEAWQRLYFDGVADDDLFAMMAE